ncbi:hypothetical protein [Brevundimonas sp. FT23028]|uniref:hypothetical protein n=1 Tax=Brevundimonas sp. FT23028 TaxID=3393748 RepID=UPI003B587B61
MSVLTGLLAATVLWGAQTPQAAPAPAPVAASQEQDVTDLGEVIVGGRPAREVASSFIETVGAPSSSRRLARWPHSVCVSVANLAQEPAQYLVDRVSEVAEDLGLRAGEPGCVANVLIIAASDASAMADALVDEYRVAFRPAGGGTTRSLSVLEDFRKVDRPVRWWHISLPVDSETGDAAVRTRQGDDPPAINISRASRLRSDIRDDLNKVIIVVDVDRLGGVNIRQLGDYIALVALAQVDLRASPTGLPTVLNLFEEPESTPGLTEWDLAYLQALYRAEPNRSTAAGQASDLAALMLRRRRAQDQEAAPAPNQP